jgi:streptogramin lyase
MRRIRFALLVVVLVAGIFGLATPAQAAPLGYTIQALDGVDVLTSIDLATGDTTEIGETEIPQSTRGMAIAPDGTLYGASNGSLYTFDTSTGAATLVGSFGCCNTVEAMAFDSSGALWLVSGNPSSLFSVDPVTGEATEVGDVNEGLLTGLAATCDGTILATDGDDDELIAIDPATADATTVGDFGVDIGMGSLSFDASGELWMLARLPAPPGAPSRTYTVDPTTGAATEVASAVSGNNPTSLAISLLDCPEPPTTTTTSTTAAPTSTTVRPAAPAARPVAAVPRFTG